jgi:hypothetical protein
MQSLEHEAKTTHKQYIYPFPNKPSRISLLNLGKSLVGSSDWYQEQWNKLEVLVQKPWFILWGTKDELITTEYLQKWKDKLSNAIVKEFDCGFVQEEKSLESIREIDFFFLKLELQDNPYPL